MYKLRTFLLLAALLTGCAEQNPQPSPALQREYDAAFQEMLAQPGNLEVVMKYATVATKAGDYEAAVAAYEGMLLIESDLPRIRLELGILYYRLKSYDVARTYLEAALQSPSLPADMRKPAEQLLVKMPRQSGSRRA